jgi:hypothetical protein
MQPCQVVDDDAGAAYRTPLCWHPEACAHGAAAGRIRYPRPVTALGRVLDRRLLAHADVDDGLLGAVA